MKHKAVIALCVKWLAGKRKARTTTTKKITNPFYNKINNKEKNVCKSKENNFEIWVNP